MELKPLVWRTGNLFRSRDVRASSPHTSVWGLIRLYNTKPETRSKIEENIKYRFFTGRNSEYGLKMPDALIINALKNTGADIINDRKDTPSVFETDLISAKVGPCACFLANFALNTKIPETLAMIIETPEKIVWANAPVWIRAAENPHTPWEAVAKALGKKVHEEPLEVGTKEFTTINIDNFEVLGSFTRPRYTIPGLGGYGDHTRSLAERILSKHEADREKIMKMVRFLNPKLHAALTDNS